jgi:hypothetical protein
MTEPKFPAECEASLRRARIEARWARRYHRREFGSYEPLDLVHDIRKAAWLSERIRVEEPDLTDWELRAMRTHLLRTLALAEMVAIDLLGDPFQVGRGNS